MFKREQGLTSRVNGLRSDSTIIRVRNSTSCKALRGNRVRTKGHEMNREELIEQLDDSTSIEADAGVSTEAEGQSESEAMRTAVAKVREKTRKDGKPYGFKEKPPARLTAKQRAFASYIVAGNSPSEAYRKAYETTTANDSTVAVSANKLMKDHRISALIGSVFDGAKEKIVADAVATRRFVMEQLHDKAVQAKTEGSQLKALELMGRAVGMFTDRVEQKVEEVSTERLKQELRSHLELLDNVTPIKKRSA